MEDAQHLLSSIRKQLLRITGVRNRLPFLRVANSQSVSYHGRNIKCIDVLEADVTQAGVGNVTDKDPSHLEDTFPLVRRPHGAAPRVVNLKQYNLSGTIHRLPPHSSAPESTSPPCRRSGRYVNSTAVRKAPWI